jgi:hypothetical protein
MKFSKMTPGFSLVYLTPLEENKYKRSKEFSGEDDKFNFILIKVHVL